MPLRHAPATVNFTRQQRLVANHFIHNPKLALDRVTGFKVSDFGLKGALGNFQIHGKNQILQVSEADLDRYFFDEDLHDDPWLARFAYATLASKLVGSHQQVVQKILIQKIMSGWKMFRKHQFRLGPLTPAGLARWWEVRFSMNGLPECPPLNHLHLN